MADTDDYDSDESDFNYRLNFISGSDTESHISTDHSLGSFVMSDSNNSDSSQSLIFSTVEEGEDRSYNDIDNFMEDLSDIIDESSQSQEVQFGVPDVEYLSTTLEEVLEPFAVNSFSTNEHAVVELLRPIPRRGISSNDSPIISLEDDGDDMTPRSRRGISSFESPIISLEDDVYEMRLRPRRGISYYESPIISIEDDGDEMNNITRRIGNEVNNESSSSALPDGDNHTDQEEPDVVVVEDRTPVSDVLQLPIQSSTSVTQGEKRRLDESVDDGMTCSICLDTFTSSGVHRLSSLRCGHLFGQSCVERWLKVGCTGGAKRCPTCNKKAAIKDIRVLYAKKLVATDTSELEKFKSELNEAISKKNKLDVEIQVCRLNQNNLKEELECLKKELELERKRTTAIALTTHNTHTCGNRLELIKTIEVSVVGGCRVMAYDNCMNLVVSTQSNNNLFPGFGIKKIDAIEFRTTSMISLHPKTIRDMSFHNVDKDILLSVSLDSTAKLLDLRCNTGLNTYTGSTPLWACCWDANKTNLFYVGGQSGVITQYDIRYVDVLVRKWEPSGDRTPIVSLAGVPSLLKYQHQQAGILSCRLHSVLAYAEECTAKWAEPRFLPILGPFLSMSYNSDTQLILTSTRPNIRQSFTTHSIHQISENFKSCNLIHSIRGSATSSVMSRSCFVRTQTTNKCYVAAYSESARRIEMFDTASGQPTCNSAVNEHISDLCPVYLNGSRILTALSDKKLMVYKYNCI